MRYEMHIQDKYLTLIKNGIKRHEYRLGKPERRAININDEIRLITNQDESVYLDVIVTGKTLYKDWYDACKDNWESDFKDLYHSFDELMEDCKNYYTPEEINEYGIIMYDVEVKDNLEAILSNIVNKLKQDKKHISFAESITGGLCASTLIGISGASNVISESLVTYSNEAKMKYLNVKKETIDKHTVVSKEVAYEMSLGLHELTKSDICVSLTGLAGPDGDGINPVGLVCFGFYICGECYTLSEVFKGNRNEIRNKAMKYVFMELNKRL